MAEANVKNVCGVEILSAVIAPDTGGAIAPLNHIGFSSINVRYRRREYLSLKQSISRSMRSLRILCALCKTDFSSVCLQPRFY